jgi:subtilisin-like proprotein convertase family protein
VATPYNLSINTTGNTITSHSGTVNAGTIPFHQEPLANLGGFIENAGDTWTFTWSDLEPLEVYEVYVFGLSDEAGGNMVQIVGDESITFTQSLVTSDLVVNSDTGVSNRTLVEFAKVVPASTSGRITITVTNAEGAPVGGIGGLAIRPGTLGSVHGQKWNDLDGNGSKDEGEPGLSGWTIFIDQNGNGEFDSVFTETLPSVDVPQVIDNGLHSEVKSELFFEGVSSVFDVNVTLDITHTYDADLEVFLISPLGTRVELFTDVGGLAENFHNTTLDDEASTPITAASAPFTGTFRPEGSLSAFDGEDPVGVWTLEIKDDAAADDGILNSWSLTITGREMSTVTDGAGNYSFDELPAGIYNIREVLQSGWAQTLGQPPVTVSSGARVTGVDFGNWVAVSQPTPGSISGQKFNDLNGNGTKESGEPGLPGWVIYIDGNDNGVLDSTAVRPATSTDVPKSINDFSTVTSRVLFSGLSSISDVNVTLDITHSFSGDVDAYLISPAGTQVELFTGVGGQFNNFVDTTLDDEAPTSISDAAAPFTGSFRPEGLLSDFIGENPNGNWTLLIRDTTDADIGILNSWTLTITGDERSTTTDADGRYTFPNLVPGDYVVREVLQPGWRQTLAPKPPIAVALSQEVIDQDFGNTLQLALPGDYNADDTVDMIDYVMWRKTMGQTGVPFSGADGDGDGVIDQDDYDVWRAHFGMTLSGTGSGSSSFIASVAESPTSTNSDALEETSASVNSSRRVPFDAGTATTIRERTAQRMAPRPAVTARTGDDTLLAWLSAQRRGGSIEPPANAEQTADDRSGHVETEWVDSVDIVFDALGRRTPR